MSKFKLCLLIPSLQAGGMERVMSELINHFSVRRDVEVHLVLYGLSREIFYKLPVEIILYKPDYEFKNRFRLYYTFKTLRYLRTTVNKIKPDSILSFGELWNSFVMLSLSGLKFPVYISDRCSPEKKFKLVHRLLRSFYYPRSEGIIVQTSKARDIYFSKFKHRNIGVIANPIRLVPEFTREERENIVLNIGRLINTKHQDRLVKLFLEMNLPEWKLVIVGYDHLNQNNSNRLREIIDLNKAGNKVILAGKQTNVDQYYRKSKLFAFTSSSEGYPNVIGEALSAGLPVVAYDCVAGPSELITPGGNGYLVPLFDDIAFRERLEYLMIHEEVRIEMSKNAVRSVKNLAVESIGPKYLNFITHSSLPQ